MTNGSLMKVKSSALLPLKHSAMLWTCIQGIYLSKALTCMKFFLYIKQKLPFFIKETDTFGHIVAWTIYTSQMDHFTPQHTVFEQSTACLSVVFELLPGFIPFAIFWHAGWTLEKNIYKNINCNYPTTIWEGIFTPGRAIYFTNFGS